MKSHNRDLLVLIKTSSLSGEAFDKHVECLNKVLVTVENNDAFCEAHELATRFSITSRKKKIVKAIESAELKPFYFLINKN